MWVKIDDGFPDHAKVDSLSDGAFRLYVAGLCHCARELTDGFIDRDRPRRLVPHFKTRHVSELVDCGLWKVAGKSPAARSSDGWNVNDYLEYNPSAAKVAADRKAAAQRMRAKRSPELPENFARSSTVRSPSPSRPVHKKLLSSHALDRDAAAPPNGGGIPEPAPPPLATFLNGTGWITPPPPAEPISETQVAANLAAIKAARTTVTRSRQRPEEPC